MKFLIVGLLSIFCSALLYSWKPIRVQTFLLPSNMKPGWVTIEYENPTCSTLEEGRLWREFKIPADGYLCTSSLMETGLTYNRYYLLDEGGKRTRLTLKERIFRPGSFSVQEGSCRITAEEFFYGSKDKLTYENPIMLDPAFIEKHHPECHRRGINSTPGP